MPATKVAQFIYKVGKEYAFRRSAGSLNVDEVFPTVEKAIAKRDKMAPAFEKVIKGVNKERGSKIKATKIERNISLGSEIKGDVGWSARKGKTVFKDQETEEAFEKLVRQWNEEVPYMNFPDKAIVNKWDEIFMAFGKFGSAETMGTSRLYTSKKLLQADISAGVRTDKRIYWWKE